MILNFLTRVQLPTLLHKSSIYSSPCPVTLTNAASSVLLPRVQSLLTLTISFRLATLRYYNPLERRLILQQSCLHALIAMTSFRRVKQALTRVGRLPLGQILLLVPRISSSRLLPGLIISVRVFDPARQRSRPNILHLITQLSDCTAESVNSSRQATRVLRHHQFQKLTWSRQLALLRIMSSTHYLIFFSSLCLSTLRPLLLLSMRPRLRGRSITHRTASSWMILKKKAQLECLVTRCQLCRCRPHPPVLATLVQVHSSSTFDPFTALASAYVPCSFTPSVPYSAPQFAVPYLPAPTFHDSLYVT